MVSTRTWARHCSWFNVKIDLLCTGSFSHTSQAKEDGLVSLTACPLAWWFQKMMRSRRLCCHWTSLVGIPKVMLSSFMIYWRRWLASWIPRYVASESKSFWKYSVSVKNSPDKLSLKFLMWLVLQPWTGSSIFVFLSVEYVNFLDVNFLYAG